MPELALTRTPEDRKAYALDGVGTVRLQGWAGRGATVEAGGRTWEVRRRGAFPPVIEAQDATGAVVGAFRKRTLRRGGTLTWHGREHALRPTSAWHPRYALVDGDRELMVCDSRIWGRRPVKVTVNDAFAVEPGLLLFAAFVARSLAADARAAAGAGA